MQAVKASNIEPDTTSPASLAVVKVIVSPF
jgi:hypothetical protein